MPLLWAIPAAGAAIGVVLIARTLRRQRFAAHDRFLREEPLPRAVLAQCATLHPQLTPAQRQRVEDGFRSYLRCSLRAGERFLAMPAQAVDDLWHLFLLDTRAYADFCQAGLGRFLHYVPASAIDQAHAIPDSLRRTWWQSCRLEGIDPRHADWLPLLFALDAELGIANGFHYVLDCRQRPTSPTGNTTHCASHLGASAGGCGGGGHGHGHDGVAVSSGDGDGDGDGDGGGGSGGGGGSS